jgi:hypothetical protein
MELFSCLLAVTDTFITATVFTIAIASVSAAIFSLCCILSLLLMTKVKSGRTKPLKPFLGPNVTPEDNTEGYPLADSQSELNNLFIKPERGSGKCVCTNSVINACANEGPHLY